jgi:hypothetical protein
VRVLAVAVAALAIGIGASVSLAARDSGASHGCGGHERWDIKVLSDDEVTQIAVNQPLRTTIDNLRNNPTRPEKVGSKTKRIRPVEVTVYSIRARLHEAKLEEDRDIHLVVQDENPAHTMIVEFPDTACEPAKSSPYAARIARAREALYRLVTRCTGKRPSFSDWTPLTGRATIKGVGFFDIKHGTEQRGRADNNIELHSVLSFTRGTCG